MIRRLPRSVGLLACLLAALLAPPVAAAQPPAWKLTVTPSATYFVSGHFGVYTIEAENVGGAPTTSAPIVIEDTPPTGLVGEKVAFYASPIGFGENGFLVTHGLCSSPLRCEYPGALGASAPAIAPGERLVMLVYLSVPVDASGSIQDRVTISGGGAAGVEATGLNQAFAEPPFGPLDFTAALSDSSSNPYALAGGHPYQFVSEFNFATYAVVTSQDEAPGEAGWERGDIEPVGDPKNIGASLPPGLIADPQAVPNCSLADFFGEECPPKTIVGDAGYRLFSHLQGYFFQIEPIYNLQPTGAYPGELGIPLSHIPITLITAGLRSGSDYGIDAGSAGVPQAGLSRLRITLWGVPAAEVHDRMRGKECSSSGKLELEAKFVNSAAGIERACENSAEPTQAGVSPTPFLRLPTQCSGSPLPITGSYNSWNAPAEYAKDSTAMSAVEGCNHLTFTPSIAVRPTTNLADAPSGLEFNLHIPQDCWQENAKAAAVEASLCPSDLHEAVVTLPQGLSVNPSSANGLGACSPAQVGLDTPVGQTPAHFSETPSQCPEQAAIGTAEVKTPLLLHPLRGVVYLATPQQNPYESLLAAYIVLEGEGLIIKLPGRIEADPVTGQITGKFLENPQTPFEDFRLNFFSGARGDLRTPAVCGTYETTSSLTPYSAPESGPPAEPRSEFETTAGPGGEGSPCPTSSPSELPNTPTFRAGTESPEAGRFTPFSLRLAREDGSQEFSRIETTLPPGLTGRLAGVAECSDTQLAVAQSREHEGGGAEEQTSPSCPASSEVGTVEVGAGAGPTPLYVQGHVYLAGPYKGAPLSLAIITPAVAGPFDLGDVMVRTALRVDPETARITAVSDPIPHILDGIPLDVRSVTLKMSRQDFTLNPTNCSEFHLVGSETSVLGSVAPLSQRFQVGDCAALPFKPKLSLSLEGSTRHAGHPGLKAVLTYPKGGPYANVASAQVNLPHSEFIDQGNLNKTCTKPVLLAGDCPASSVYGKATAWTPLLEKPLEGPVYLVGGYGYKLPALVAELDGQIRVLLVGKVDSGKNKGIRNTFEAVPDAPVEKFVLEMKGGPKYSLLENSEDLCARPQKAIASFTAQNGDVLDLHPTVANGCGKKHKGHKGHRRGHGKSGHHGAARLQRVLAGRLGGGW